MSAQQNQLKDITTADFTEFVDSYTYVPVCQGRVCYEYRQATFAVLHLLNASLASMFAENHMLHGEFQLRHFLIFILFKSAWL